VSGRDRIAVIDRDECLRLLAGEEVGRLAVVVGNSPTIVPVNYVLDGEDVIVRTDPGTKLTWAPRGRACFEIDRIRPGTRSGWSVVVTGRMEEVTRFQPSTWDRIRQLGVDPWAGGDKEHWLRLASDRITGRRLGDG
jgi:uncharacterized protein